MLHQQTTLNCRGILLDLEKPIVMGILNLTPDSFYDGGQLSSADLVLKKAKKMIEEGASIIDVGGMSSRPGAEIISIKEELERVLPAIEMIHAHFPNVPISIDTVHAEVLKKAVEAGASIANDISAGTLDEGYLQMVADLRLPYILMHMQGKPSAMQSNPTYEDVTLEVLDFFIAKVERLRELGVVDIIVDPGFGFGKSLEHNYELLSKTHVFKILGLPIMVGLSRKSMVYKALKINSSEALNGSTALHMIALQQGARILRVHDVKEAVETIELFSLIPKED